MAKVERTDVPGWTKGINKEADPYTLEDGEVADALNVDFGKRGEVSRRDGYTRIDVPYEMGVASHAILTWRSDDNEFLFALGASDRKVWYGSILVP